MMSFVDDYGPVKWTRYLKKSQMVAALMSFIANVTTPARLMIGTIKTYREGKPEGRFQKKLDICHKLTPPGTSQYDGVAERVLSFLKQKPVAIMETVEEGYSPKLWAEAMSTACNKTNASTTTKNEMGVLPFEKGHGAPCSPHGIQPLGMAGHMRLGARDHKLTQWVDICVMLGIDKPTRAGRSE